MRALNIIAVVATLFAGSSAIAAERPSFDPPADGNYVKVCVDFRKFIVCENGLQVGVDFVNDHADSMETTLDSEVDNPAGFIWVEGDEKDTVTAYDVLSEERVGDYTILTGAGGALKINNKIKIVVVNE